MTAEDAQQNHWDGDLLERRQIANFLHRLILQKTLATGSTESLCFAIDADWGTGKTFFLKRWAKDLRLLDHPVIEFDAWANDLSEEPLIGFLAEIRTGLEPWIEKIPLAETARATAKEKMGELLIRGRKALLPAAGVALKSYLSNKFDLPGVIEALKDGDASNFDFDVAAGSEALGKSLDRLFENAIIEHDKTKAAVQGFKKSLSSLLTYLKDHTSAQLPLFIIIDELDRCRPDYAIRLLEGIKHLFDAPGVCFVVSTNLGQMKESVRAIYGNGFDGYQYLKRFFSFEYQLPTPSQKNYCLALANAHPGLSGKKISSGLPNSNISGKTQPEVIALHLDLIGSAFNLSLRSLHQIAFISEAAISGISKEKSVFPLLLFSLAAVLHRTPQNFNALEAQISEQATVGKIFKDAGFKDKTISFTDSRSSAPHDQSLFSVIYLHLTLARTDLKTTINSRNGMSDFSDARYFYPQSLAEIFLQEFPSGGYQPQQEYLSSAYYYFNLLRAAGFLHQ